MKRRTLAALAVRTLLGAAFLMGTSAVARAASPFVAGSHWTGMRVSAVGGGSSSAKLDVTNNPAVGVLNLAGQPVAVSIVYQASGTVDFNGLGNNAGLKVHGVVAPQGGTYSMSGSYQSVGVAGMHDDRGRLSLMRSYKTVTGGPAGAGTGGSAGTPGALPPGPCFGSFVSQSGAVGRLVVENNSQPDPERPGEFVGAIYMNDMTFLVVGKVSPDANEDGSFQVDIIGENLNPSSGISEIKASGLLLPAVRTSPLSFIGNYELIGLLRTLDTGQFKVSP